MVGSLHQDCWAKFPIYLVYTNSIKSRNWFHLPNCARSSSQTPDCIYRMPFLPLQSLFYLRCCLICCFDLDTRNRRRGLHSIVLDRSDLALQTHHPQTVWRSASPKPPMRTNPFSTNEGRSWSCEVGEEARASVNCGINELRLLMGVTSNK